MAEFFKQLRQAIKAALATDKLLHASACFVLAVVFSLLLKKVDGGYGGPAKGLYTLEITG